MRLPGLTAATLFPAGVSAPSCPHSIRKQLLEPDILVFECFQALRLAEVQAVKPPLRAQAYSQSACTIGSFVTGIRIRVRPQTLRP